MSLLRYGRRAASCHAGETDRVSLANAWSAKWASSTPAGISRKRQGSSSCKKIQRSSSVIHGSPTGLAFSHAFLCFLWPKARVKQSKEAATVRQIYENLRESQTVSESQREYIEHWMRNCRQRGQQIMSPATEWSAHIGEIRIGQNVNDIIMTY